MKRNGFFKKCISSIVMMMFMLSLILVQAPVVQAKTYQTPIADPASDTVVLNVKIGGVTLPYKWGDISGASGYKFAGLDTTGTYLNAGDTCEGITLADLLADIESTLGITLADDDSIQGISSDGYGNAAFPVAEAKDFNTNHYMLANKVNGTSEACIGYNSSDPTKTYPTTYLRIARNRGSQDGFGNSAYMRLISSIEIKKADGTAVALANVNLSQHNGLGLDMITPAAAGLVIGGSNISQGAGLLGSLAYYNQAQVDYAKANKNVNGLGLGSSWAGETRYSSYDNHGTPEYVYRLSEGINLRTALTALGADVSSAPVDIVATASDDYEASVGDAFGYTAPRNYIAPDGTVGAVVDPILIFHDNKVETSSPDANTVVPAAGTTAPIADANPLFAYGQNAADEQTNCKFVKNTVKIRVDTDAPAFTITQDGTTKSISLSNIAMMGIYQTSYFFDNGGSYVTQSLVGVPLSVLLEELGITIPGSKGLIINVDNGSGSVAAQRTISYSEISKCFLAFDAFENSKRVTGCNTPLRIYCPGTTQEKVLIENVVGASVADVNTGTIGDREPGGDINNSVFYMAVKDASAQTKYYYYTRAELESYEKQEAYTYDDHSVIKTVTCKGALLKDLLDDLSGVTITNDMVVQYAEEDGYHADAGTSVANSNYKDTAESLSNETLDGSGNTKKAIRSIVSYAIHEEYANPDANNVNDPPGVFKDADNNSGYLRVYRDTGGANSAVMKYIMGVVVSTDGALLSGTNGCVVRCVSDKNTSLKVRNDITIKGLLPEMQYAVKAPAVTNASLAAGETSPVLITVGSGAPADQVITFKYTEDTYFYVNNAINNTTTNYTYTDLIASHKQVPDASTNTSPYGYSRPMYYRYNGVWLSALVSGLSGDYTIKLVAKDGSKLDITDDIGLYFVAYNHTQSKSSTNIPEGKRVTITYNDAKIIIPSTGVNVTGSAADDYSSAGKDVDVLMAAAEGLEITANGGGENNTTATVKDNCVTMASGNQTVSNQDNTWVLSVSGRTLKDTLTEADIELTGLPIGLAVTIAKNGSSDIMITVAGSAESALSQSLNISAKVLKSAFTEADATDTNTVTLKLQQLSDCFIATAAFGSYLDAHVKVLRNFRDTVLLKSKLGRWFVNEYYRHSPPIAAMIRVHPTLKWAARILLTPIIFGIEYPLQGIIMLIGLLGIFVYLRRRNPDAETI
ncbi:MAG: CFI-box-CTERM domain-containing protein [Methanobacterium sp.]